MSFSSLFIGKDSSTSATRCADFCDVVLSVPSSSGRTLQLGEGVEVWEAEDLSVPSSSGRTLQRWPARHQSLESLHFQFPLHREGLFNLRRLLFAGGVNMTFSSLFIGKDSSTMKKRNPAGSRLVLSVPSSSGRTLQQFSQTSCLLLNRLFQFPLHREGLFNRQTIVRNSRGSSLSVPSSSGRTLQPESVARRGSPTFTFSSLFIGKDSSTGRARTLQRAARPFQFPLHREGLFN